VRGVGFVLIASSREFSISKGGGGGRGGGGGGGGKGGRSFVGGGDCGELFLVRGTSLITSLEAG